MNMLHVHQIVGWVGANVAGLLVGAYLDYRFKLVESVETHVIAALSYLKRKV